MDILKIKENDILHIAANLRIKCVPTLSEVFLKESLYEMGSELQCCIKYTDPDVWIEMQWDEFVTYRNTKIIVDGNINLI